MKSYIQNKGSAAISTVDTNPFPASGCTDTDTPGACITDTQLQAEIKKVMALKKWTGGLSNMFFVFTSSGEGSCFDSISSSVCVHRLLRLPRLLPELAPHRWCTPMSLTAT